MSDDYEGWCGGHTVHIEDDDPRPVVLGPDGRAINDIAKPQVGFDLRPTRTVVTNPAKKRGE